jgi:hypothetical protein
MIVSLLMIAYFVGVGVALAPTIKAKWSSAPASQFVAITLEDLPRALSWPVTAYRGIADSSAPEKSAVPVKPSAAE